MDYRQEKIELTKKITLDQYDRFKDLTINELALHHMGEITSASVARGTQWWNRCRAIEWRIGSENRQRNFANWKPEPKWVTRKMEEAEVIHYEG